MTAEEKLKEIFEKQLNIKLNDMNASRSIISEWDSLSHIMIILEIEKEFETEIPFEDTELINCPNDFLKYIANSARE